MHDTASELCNELLERYFEEYYYFSDAEKKWIININLKSYFMIIVCGQKMNKNRLINKHQLIKNMWIYLICHQ